MKYIENQTEIIPDDSFNIQELGYLVQMITESSHGGNALELALTIKKKLQSKLDNLMKTKETM